jgi:SAM-dependent methyltransferase
MSANDPAPRRNGTDQRLCRDGGTRLERMAFRSVVEQAPPEETQVEVIDYTSIAAIYDAFVTVTADVPFFIAETKKTQGEVLELTSGTGRLSLPLLEAGVRLTCVDYSPGMVEVLTRKIRERGLPADVLCADVCALELPQKFDLALVPFQAFMEIIGEERQREALAAVYKCLRPGGRFVCTMHNPPVRARQIDGIRRYIGGFPYENGTLAVSGFEQGGKPVVARTQFFEFFDAQGRLAWTRMLPMEFEMIERDDFERMAVDAGFRVEQLYGNYERAEFDPENSPVMIWMLEKTA